MLLAIPVPAEVGQPMYWCREFPGRTDQARAVRAFAAHLLTDVPGLDDILLVLNELVVNALRHSRSGEQGGHFTVEVRSDVAGVIVSVRDEGGAGRPRLRDADPLAEGGRGLLTVEALAATWSWKGDAHGRTVRATFPAHRPAP
ncbi:ATP-binding protein [Actinomadura fibrosa]|uniref:ATP-binding protein n=1 Tax=Actinomadura fibrosa TaxID=111802 RepID=A0ABW2XCB7_9ACTN|nr:ATP-binding protein [Actinomadura fibrosa]